MHIEEVVSIHSLRKKGDEAYEKERAYREVFQSTPFARRETIGKVFRAVNSGCFNPLPSQEGRR